MLLFDDYDTMYEFLHENLPDKVKYEFLYTRVAVHVKPTDDPIRAKYGRKEVAYAVFIKLKNRGYAYWLESKESVEKTFERQKQVLLWSRIQDDIEDNVFPSEMADQYKLISINDACKFLGLTRPSVYKLIRDNEFPVIQIFDKTKRIQMRDLLLYIERKKHKPSY